MDELFNPLDFLWGNLLSRQPDRIRDAFSTLSPEEQQAVLSHLRNMATEPGWHAEQSESARRALDALEIGE